MRPKSLQSLYNSTNSFIVGLAAVQQIPGWEEIQECIFGSSSISRSKSIPIYLSISGTPQAIPTQLHHIRKKKKKKREKSSRLKQSAPCLFLRSTDEPRLLSKFGRWSERGVYIFLYKVFHMNEIYI